MHMDSVVSVLISAFLALAFLALVVRIISKRVAAVLMLVWLFFCVIHPVLRQQILSVVSPLVGVILPLLLMLLGLRIIIRGKVR